MALSCAFSEDFFAFLSFLYAGSADASTEQKPAASAEPMELSRKRMMMVRGCCCVNRGVQHRQRTFLDGGK